MAPTDVVYLAVVLVLSWGNSQAQSTEYSCKLETDGSMKMTLRSNAYAALVAWEVGVGETNCPAVDDGGYQALTIITDSGRLQTTPALGTADCKVQAPAGDTTQTIYNVFHYSDANFLQDGDGYFILTCDTDTANGVFVTVDPATSVSYSPTGTTKTESVDDHVLELVDSATPTTVLTSVNVGDTCKLKMTFTRTLAENAVSQGTHVQKTEVAGQSDFSDATEIFNTNGCPAIAAGNAMHCATGFIDDSSDATSFVSLSAEFVIAAKRGSNTLYFRAEYDDACPLGTENPCYDIEAYCASLRRKRRSAGSGTSSGNVTTTVKVTFGSGSTAGQGGEEGENVETDEPFCRETYKFWIVAIVLGVLLLIAMLFAIYLYFRLRREQRTNEKLADRVGFSNPSVQS